MAKVTDLLNSLGFAEDGITTTYPETFVPDLQAAYADDMSIPDARIQVLENDLALAQNEILMLKAHNYELITTSAVTDDAPVEDEPEESEESDDDSEGVDGLFKEKE